MGIGEKRFSNISWDICAKYVELCSCRVNQWLPYRPEGITPILTQTMNDTGQVDLIDMQAQEFNGYKWILHYKITWQSFLIFGH